MGEIMDFSEKRSYAMAQWGDRVTFVSPNEVVSGRIRFVFDENVFYVEPDKRQSEATATGKSIQPSLDSMTRLVVTGKCDSTGAGGSRLFVDVWMGRRSSDDFIKVASGIELGTEALDGTLSPTVIDNPFPPQALTDPSEGSLNIDNPLYVEFRIIPTASYDTGFSVSALLMPGPITSTSRPPRGSIFSNKSQNTS